MPTLKDVMVILEKLNLSPNKISVNKKVFQEIVDKAKELSFTELIKKKIE